MSIKKYRCPSCSKKILTSIFSTTIYGSHVGIYCEKCKIEMSMELHPTYGNFYIICNKISNDDYILIYISNDEHISYINFVVNDKSERILIDLSGSYTHKIAQQAFQMVMDYSNNQHLI